MFLALMCFCEWSFNVFLKIIISDLVSKGEQCRFKRQKQLSYWALQIHNLALLVRNMKKNIIINSNTTHTHIRTSNNDDIYLFPLCMSGILTSDLRGMRKESSKRGSSSSGLGCARSVPGNTFRGLSAQ